MDGSIVIYAKGYVLTYQGSYRAGIKLSIDGYELEVTVEDQVFESSDECASYLVNELPRIVSDICDKMGLKQVRADYHGATCQEMQ